MSFRSVLSVADTDPLMSPCQAIAIIGGGLSGSLVAAHLLRTVTTPLTLHLIDAQAEIGRGVAYRTPFDCHLLNVPAKKMSAFADDPDHFVRWLRSQPDCNQPDLADQFVSRNRYGQYIQAILREAEQSSQAVQFHRWHDEAIALYPDSNGAKIMLRNGSLQVDRVVLALGNFAPKPPAVADPAFYASSRYVNAAWSFTPSSDLAPSDPVVLIGTGLTAIDTVLSLRQAGHRGTIHLVSRRGLLPQTHKTAAPHQAKPFTANKEIPLSRVLELETLTVRTLLRWIRHQVKAGQDWRDVIDSLRPDSAQLWRSLPLSEQRRFLRHLRVYWDTHRHRIAPAVAETIDTLRQQNQLQIHAARIVAYQEDETGVNVIIRPRCCAETSTIYASQVINCTGTAIDYRNIDQPLIQMLLQAGLVRPDPLALGLDVAANGALIDAIGTPSNWLYTLGSARRGQLWETTAVREIREQARSLSQELWQSIGERQKVGSRT
jgi:uncharacterized NAD(P)/FAD-binding protein YdhS